MRCAFMNCLKSAHITSLSMSLISGLSLISSNANATDVTHTTTLHTSAIQTSATAIEKGVTLAGGTRNQQFKLSNPANQRQYLIQVYQSQTPAPKAGFPVIYLLDGNAAFPYASVMTQAIEFSYAHHHQAPPLIVAIGYDVDSTIDVKARTFDYTPPIQGELISPANRPNPPYPIGGAEQFYQFIQTQLKPFIAKHYPIHPQQQSLFGHSYGGLFTLYTMLNHPEAFQHYYAASPSIWWHDDYLIKQAQSFQNKYQHAGMTQPLTVYLSVGEQELKEHPQKSTQVEQPTYIARFANTLSNIKNMQITQQVIADASHFEAMFPAINHAIHDSQSNNVQHKDNEPIKLK